MAILLAICFPWDEPSSLRTGCAVEPGLCLELCGLGVHGAGWDLGGTGVMLLKEGPCSLFPASEAAEVGASGSLGT